MALMMGSLYDALRSANVDDEKARKAAEEIANYDNRTSKIEGKLNLIQWMLATNIALSVAVFLKVLA